MPSAGSAIASADLAAGHQGPTASVAGEACAPVASAVVGLAVASAVSAEEDSAAEDSAAAGSGVRLSWNEKHVLLTFKLQNFDLRAADLTDLL